MPQITISLCMIVKNEEEVLARCLESVSGLADEIIIVDTGSTDGTVQIARQYTEKVYHFAWIDDFSAARNYAFSLAQKDYILWLDADDIIKEKDKSAFLGLKTSMPEGTDIVMMKYDLAVDKEGKPSFSNFRERLIRRGAGLQWIGPVHEVVLLTGKIIYRDDIAVSHMKLKASEPGRNLKIMEKHIAAGGILDARQMFYYARELSDNARHDAAADIYSRFLARGDGWTENKIEACRGLSYCLLKAGRHEESLLALFKSFCYDAPRAEVCCDIGGHFLERKNYQTAAYWYEQAKAMKPMPERGGFINADCYGYIPAIQLCVCYYALGETEKAKAYNDQAAACKPDDESVKQNKEFFDSLCS